MGGTDDCGGGRKRKSVSSSSLSCWQRFVPPLKAQLLSSRPRMAAGQQQLSPDAAHRPSLCPVRLRMGRASWELIHPRLVSLNYSTPF